MSRGCISPAHIGLLAFEDISQEQKGHTAIFDTILPPDQARKAKLGLLKSNLAELARELATKHRIKVEKYLPKNRAADR